MFTVLNCVYAHVINYQLSMTDRDCTVFNLLHSKKFFLAMPKKTIYFCSIRILYENILCECEELSFKETIHNLKFPYLFKGYS